MWRFWIVYALIGCLSLEVTPRPAGTTDDDFNDSGSGMVNVDNELRWFDDDVWYGDSRSGMVNVDNELRWFDDDTWLVWRGGTGTTSAPN